MGSGHFAWDLIWCGVLFWVGQGSINLCIHDQKNRFYVVSEIPQSDAFSCNLTTFHHLLRTTHDPSPGIVRPSPGRHACWHLCRRPSRCQMPTGTSFRWPCQPPAAPSIDCVPVLHPCYCLHPGDARCPTVNPITQPFCCHLAFTEHGLSPVSACLLPQHHSLSSPYYSSMVEAHACMVS